jgi:hypothetical protein
MPQKHPPFFALFVLNAKMPLSPFFCGVFQDGFHHSDRSQSFPPGLVGEPMRPNGQLSIQKNS